MEARVQKFIALSGLCSRRKAEDLIAQGVVTVNGKETKLGDKCESTDKIEVEGKPIKFDIDDNIYIVMNKPKGVVCSKDDPHNRVSVYGELKESDNRDNLFSVGRLDKDTTGLIILTNDGHFSQKVIHPKSKIIKLYEVKLNKELETDDKSEIEKGLTIEGYELSECVIKKCEDRDVYTIAISEGRKRQIRRVFELKEYQVRGLKRVSIGGLRINKFKLKEGEYKLVSKEDLEKEIFK